METRRNAKKMADMDYCELTFTLANNSVHVSHPKIAQVGKTQPKFFTEPMKTRTLRIGDTERLRVLALKRSCSRSGRRKEGRREFHELTRIVFAFGQETELA